MKNISRFLIVLVGVCGGVNSKVFSITPLPTKYTITDNTHKFFQKPESYTAEGFAPGEWKSSDKKQLLQIFASTEVAEWETGLQVTIYNKCDTHICGNEDDKDAITHKYMRNIRTDPSLAIGCYKYKVIINSITDFTIENDGWSNYDC